jgi:hypothetical protein
VHELTNVYLGVLKRCIEFLYKREVRAVLSTSPVRKGGNDFVALSMVHQRDVLPYLVAIKSFARHTQPARVVVVCDPSITESDRDVFRRHIPHVELLNAQDHRHPDLPIGGCWERLQAIARQAQTAYTVQVDADTVTLGDLPEVVSAARQGQGFVLGEIPSQRIVSLEEASRHACDWGDEHIQAFVEKRLATSGLRLRSYVRGCAGFTGFPMDGDMMPKLLEFSACMRDMCGKRWDEWGSEQISSNFIVANAHATSVLPVPDYCTPEGGLEGVRFGHFIGYMRFRNNLYRKATRLALDRF